MLEARPSRPPWEVSVVPIELVLRSPDAVFIDLRSPSEHAEDHISGASNVPLFDDAQRAVIGTLYRQVSPAAAFEEGRRVVEREVSALVAEICRLAREPMSAVDLAARAREMTAGGFERFSAELECKKSATPPVRPIVCYCWRGGLRSRSVVALLRAMGMQRAVALEGGYRAYRAHVLAGLEAWQPPPFFVLRGLTGVGKTLVLRELEARRPGWTIDLEAMAGHRSSLLGMVGLQPCSQRTFESRLFERIRRGFPPWAVVEGESRKVGDVILPRRLWRALSSGTSLELTAPLETRIENLIADYSTDSSHRAELGTQIAIVQARMTKRVREVDLVRLLADGRDAEVVAVLLEHYYDPLYKHGEAGRVCALSLDSSPPARAAAEIADWIEARCGRAARAC